ncbi:50S ribosomal protein L4 [Candidatus Woesebacteria bacterium CG_4_10_14_0_2_um_filter_39_14]|uniref:Large ribosomal subunit protein uL4 n=1 Tax=Candidatus Woesebacteria bacterium CG_4_10_14_0_2_um_filter_39_14 TaxID=1975054 RepID=A0A2M7TJ84_9BACT|nr:MAG: 50S ribosomal protein L4 [Candidatus Woesebacteria bacterium CG_4_10_14_0_2_um_filter_39_14]
MPKVDLYTLSGTKSGQMELPKEIFAAKINEPLMAQAVRVYLSNQRKAQAKVKSRGEIAKTSAKWFRQKGTGRARHGARSAPIFVGGGVAHGPTGEQNYQLKMPKKMKKQALFSALTSKFKTNEVLVIKDLAKIEPKTKKMKTILEKLAKDNKATIILSEKLENVARAARNLKGLNLSQANQLNPYEVLNGGQLIFMKEAVEKLKEKWI